MCRASWLATRLDLPEEGRREGQRGEASEIGRTRELLPERAAAEEGRDIGPPPPGSMTGDAGRSSGGRR
jgi:hypothetical protein